MTAKVRCCENKGSVTDLVHKIFPEEKRKNEHGIFLEIGIHLLPFFKTVFLCLWLFIEGSCDHKCLPGKVLCRFANVFS